MHRTTAEFKASGIEQQARKIGDRAPSYTLFNQDHVQVSSSDLLRQGPLVIKFFRGQASALQDRLTEEMPSNHPKLVNITKLASTSNK